MEQLQIQYAKTSDGVSIAYWAVGEGPPLVFLPPQAQHVQLDWDLSTQRGTYEWLAANNRLIRFDARNTGLSDRGVEDVSLEARRRDLDAIIDRLGLDNLSFYAMGFGDLALAYAVDRPDRVRRLVLLNLIVPFPDVPRSPAIALLPQLLEADWETFTETLAGMVWGWSADEQTRKQASLMRESATWEDTKRMFSSRPPLTATLLPLIKSPTLVVHCRDAIGTDIKTGRRLAAAIPGARLFMAEGRALRSIWEDPKVRAAVDAFLGDDVKTLPVNTADPQRPASAVTTVLFTDIVGHTEMMQRLGDTNGRDVLREHERITRDLLKEHSGAEVKTMGDGFMASFSSVTKAMECAIALQRAFAEHNEKDGEPLHVRVGLNAGEPIEEAGDLFGATVILASRIAAKAGAGEIFIPDTVRGLLSGKGFVFGDRGEFVPKGFDEGVRLWDVRWRE